MEFLETKVIAHYQDGTLLTRILHALNAANIDIDNLSPIDLAPVEEFHIGGRAATEYALSKMHLDSAAHILDIGCGIGGAARYIASQFGNSVTGIDLTPEYIAVAHDLTARLGLSNKIRFENGSALSMPFDDASFDAAITLHVAMNISDRNTLYAETARVLKPGALLCIYDVMKQSEGALAFPVPWAQTAQTSHLITKKETLRILSETGFTIISVEDRTKSAKEFFRLNLARQSKNPTPLGIHLMMGPTAPDKLKNVILNIENGYITPVQIIAKKTTL